eukprot:2442405-Rhodomonas_salina.1
MLVSRAGLAVIFSLSQPLFVHFLLRPCNMPVSPRGSNLARHASLIPTQRFFNGAKQVSELEKERNFYYDRLRAVELLCQDTVDSHLGTQRAPTCSGCRLQPVARVARFFLFHACFPLPLSFASTMLVLTGDGHPELTSRALLRSTAPVA